MEAATENKTAEPKSQTPAPKLPTFDLDGQVAEIIKGVHSQAPRIVSRVLRKFFITTRKHLTKANLEIALSHTLTLPKSGFLNPLMEFVSHLPQKMDLDTKVEQNTQAVESAPSAKVTDPVPEVEIFLGLIVTVALIDNKLHNQAAACSSLVVEKLQPLLNRRTLNPLAARVFFFYHRSYELCNRLAEIRPTLFSAHRMATLHHDDETSVTILNLLLRNYLHYNLYAQADKLQSKAVVKKDTTSSNQLARFRYYRGRIRAIQLDYTRAYEDLQEAIRKAPQNSARGFRVTVHKLACIVQLLIGEIPERSIFRQPGLKGPLKPYLRLIQAVRVGDLTAFHDVVKTFGDGFRRDKTFTLIQRLHHNVIKTGLRKINVSYSRISLLDICSKLHLGNVADAEFIVAKAIRDGVIDATIDHEGGFIRSKENLDVYSTQGPQVAFGILTKKCIKMHNEAVKAMRYPPDLSKKRKIEDEEREERKKQEQDIADKLAEGDEEDEI